MHANAPPHITTHVHSHMIRLIKTHTNCCCTTQAADPPLLRLEAEASHAYLSVLMHVLSYPKDTANIKGRSKATPRMVRLCTSTLARFAQVGF